MEKKSTQKAAQPCNNPECKRVREKLREEIRRLKSASYDMIKQTGDWQCGGRTHEDHSEMFDSLFLHKVDDLCTQLQAKSDLDQTTARQMLCYLFQNVYEKCRARVLDRMKTTLSTVTSVSAGPSVSEAEALHDACRAYGLLLHSSSLRQVPEHSEISVQVHTELMQAQQKLSAAEEELKIFTSKVAEMSWGLLTTVPPLVSSQPSRYSRYYHHKENWDTEQGDKQMVYFRPVLFSSYEGRVAQKGWVSNQTMQMKDSDKLSLGLPAAVEKSSQKDINHPFTLHKPYQPSSVPNSRAPANTIDNYSDFVMVGDESKSESSSLSVRDVLSDLLQPAASVVQGHEGGEEEGDSTVDYEALPLFRLMNK